MEINQTETIIRTSESTKQAHKRIDGLELKIETIHDLTLSVKEIATEMKEMRKDQADMNARLKIIEERPSKNWSTIISSVITTVVGAVVGALVMLVIK